MSNNIELIKILKEEAEAYKNQAEAFGCEARVRLEIADLLRKSKLQDENKKEDKKFLLLHHQ